MGGVDAARSSCSFITTVSASLIFHAVMHHSPERRPHRLCLSVSLVHVARLAVDSACATPSRLSRRAPMLLPILRVEIKRPPFLSNMFMRVRERRSSQSGYLVAGVSASLLYSSLLNTESGGGFHHGYALWTVRTLERATEKRALALNTPNLA